MFYTVDKQTKPLKPSKTKPNICLLKTILKKTLYLEAVVNCTLIIQNGTVAFYSSYNYISFHYFCAVTRHLKSLLQKQY